MNVKALIKALSLFPPEMTVLIRSPRTATRGFRVGRVRMDLAKTLKAGGQTRISFRSKDVGVVRRTRKGERDTVVIDAR